MIIWLYYKANSIKLGKLDFSEAGIINLFLSFAWHRLLFENIVILSMVFIHSFVFLKHISLNCCYTRRSAFWFPFLIYDIKNRLRIIGVRQSKIMKKIICENWCQTFNSLFLSKKFKFVVLCRFTIANLTAASRRMNLNNEEQIFVENIVRGKKHKMLEEQTY